MNITKERIDEVFITAVENNLLNLTDDISTAMEKFPDENKSLLAYIIATASVVQGNVMAAMKEVLYELFIEKEE